MRIPSAILLSCLAPALAATAVDFAHEIAPVFKQHCADCHLGEKKKGGLSMNTRESLLQGSENGVVFKPGEASGGSMVERLLSTDPDERMPPKGDRVPKESIEKIRAWIQAGATWEPGFTFGAVSYEPPLKPNKVAIPAPTAGLTHPVDLLLNAKGWKAPAPVSDAVYLRRVHLDLIGILPTTAEVGEFLKDSRTDKRARLVESLLARRQDYAEHWMTFWNDLLRNDYVGTGYIDGGRRQITRWLYDGLKANKPYDRFVRELIAPDGNSDGFINGIKWRGDVNASQVREIQFAQSVSQVFLGINMKCASCHDSFIDRWKLDEAYNLAAIYATTPLEIHRCDVATGRKAKPEWIFPELGNVDPAAPQPERLKQLAGLMTHPENGRFTRTLVNRLWQRLMGRGIVDPVDAMHAEPFNADLLDHLAVHFQDNGYDMQKTLAYIATSRAYQAPTALMAGTSTSGAPTFAGPLARRLTAEQFMDALWTLTGTTPDKVDADVSRGSPRESTTPQTPSARWIWRTAEGSSSVPVAGETATFKTTFTLAKVPPQARAVITCDNEYILYVNGKKVAADTDWPTVEIHDISNLKKGENTILIAAKNAGNSPNAAALFFELAMPPGFTEKPVATAAQGWTWTEKTPNAKGVFGPGDIAWQPAAEVANQRFLPEPVHQQLAAALGSAFQPKAPVRASLVKADLLMRALGRPNREQIVSTRPAELTTLEAITLSNGEALAKIISSGAGKLGAKFQGQPGEFIDWIFLSTLCRPPTADEKAALLPSASGDEAGIEDILWSVLMLPEFQMVL